MNYIYCCRLQV